MTSASYQPSQRSWADIVKGQEQDSPADAEQPMPTSSSVEAVLDATPAPLEQPTSPEQPTQAPDAGPPGIFTTPSPPTPAPLKPGARGSLLCFCRGMVSSMLSYYGWLETFANVDHPLVSKHLGRIYVQKSDIVDGQILKAGDIVSFYLYADNVGLGAEKCKLEKEQLAPEATSMAASNGLRVEAAEFVPGGDFVSPSDGAHKPVADVFARMSRAFESIPANGVVQMVGFNSAYFDDDDSSEDGDAESVAADGESLHEESGHSSGEDPDIMQKVQHETLVRMAPWQTKRAVSPDRSTSEGMTSDASLGISSESENEGMRLSKLSPPPGLQLPAFRPPPGLSLPGPDEVM